MKRVFKFIKALITYLLWGEQVSFEDYVNRLIECHNCEDRKSDICGNCGCILHKKAKWSTEGCPKNKW
jgi:hypothetical protein